VPAALVLLPWCCSNLKRYLHYLTRYEANLQSQKLEEKLRKVGGRLGGRLGFWAGPD